MIASSLDLELELLSALMNHADAAKGVVGLSAEHFSEASLGVAFDTIMADGEAFTLATVLAAVDAYPNGRELVLQAYEAPYYLQGLPTTVNGIIEAYKRREAQNVLTWMDNGISLGKSLEEVLAEHKPKLEALSLIGGKASRFQALRVSEIQIPVTNWLVKGVMPMAGVGFVAGASKAGKSFLTLEVGLSLASGRGEVLGRKCKRAGVIYVAAEDFEGCKGRVKAWQIHNRVKDNQPFRLIGGQVDLMDAACVDDLCRAILEAAEQFRAGGVELGLVVFDTLARCLVGADENSAQDMGRAIRALETVAERTGAFVAAVAHHGKQGASAGVRGWSGVDAASDMTITVERSEDDPALRMVTFSKIKNGVDGGQLGFRLKSVSLGVPDEDGEEQTSCVCEFEESPEKQTKSEGRRLPDAAAIALRAIRLESDLGAVCPIPEGAPQRHWSKGVNQMACRDRAMAIGFAFDQERPQSANMRFYKQLETLVAAGKINMDGRAGVLWLM